jgi:hypothetical protein
VECLNDHGTTKKVSNSMFEKSTDGREVCSQYQNIQVEILLETHFYLSSMFLFFQYKFSFVKNSSVRKTNFPKSKQIKINHHGWAMRQTISIAQKSIDICHFFSVPLENQPHSIHTIKQTFTAIHPL